MKLVEKVSASRWASFSQSSPARSAPFVGPLALGARFRLS